LSLLELEEYIKIVEEIRLEEAKRVF